MRTANLEADGLVRDAFVCTSDAFCLLQDLLPHLLEVIEAFAYSSKVTCLCLISRRQCVDHHQSQSVRAAAAPGKCRNSPQSLPAELDFTSCRTKGLLVQISGPLGKKSLPTWSIHNHHIGNHTKRSLMRSRQPSNPRCNTHQSLQDT